MKKADRNLVVLLIFCLFMGLFIIGDVLYLYLNHDFSNLWDKPLPINVYKPIIKASLVLTCVVLPSLGVGFLLVGYGIWDYRRKRGPINQHDNDDDKMNQRSRPTAVKLALIFLLATFSTAIAEDVVAVHWNYVSAYIRIGVRLILFLVLLGFIFLGMNWARWLLVILSLAGIYLEISWIIQHSQTLSTLWTVEFCLHGLLNVVAIIMLFLPSSNNWFRGYSNPSST